MNWEKSGSGVSILCSTMGRKREKPNPSIEGEKRMEKKNGQPLPLPLPATSEEEEEEEEEFRRNWSGLPELALHSIFRRLVTIPDLLSFSSVCRSWNSLSSSTSTDLSTSSPPLLLLPVLQNPNPSRSLRAHRSTTWSHPPRCRLQTLETLGRSFQSKIPSRTLALPFLGYNNGHLIFNLSRSRSRSNYLLLANIFSGKTTRIPLPSPPLSPFPHIALLTDTDLLLASNSSVLSYHRATASWSQLNHGAASLAVSSRDNSNQLFSIDCDAANLRVIEFTPAASDATPGAVRSKPMQVPSPPLPGPFILRNDFAHRLVDRGGDLLLLRFVLQFLPPIRWRIDVFKLDPERSTWVEVESLGNWCLFVDTVGSCTTACPEPGRWGGRSNCVYVTGPGCDSWVLVPVDGDRLFTICEPTTTMPRWPSPVWVYPSKLKYNYQNDT